jgi:ABC-2 type transport system permease protein
MTSQSNDKPNKSVINTAFNIFTKTFTIAGLEVQKIIHDPSSILTRSFQPIIWLLLFGQVMAQAHFIEVKGMTYLEYLTPGILAQSILFVAIFYGIAIIWERDLGIIQKLLVTPTPRIALVAGKALAAGVLALSQVIVIYLLAALIGVKLSYSPTSILGILIFTFLGAGIFSTFSLIIACIVKTRERFMGIGQVLTMPLFFASNAIYPISIMPPWIKVFAHFNPLTYEVDAFRVFMLSTPSTLYGVYVDFLVLAATLLGLLLIGAKIYPRIAR